MTDRHTQIAASVILFLSIALVMSVRPGVFCRNTSAHETP